MSEQWDTGQGRYLKEISTIRGCSSEKRDVSTLGKFGQDSSALLDLKLLWYLMSSRSIPSPNEDRLGL